MKKAILACLLFLAALPLLAKPQYTSADSAKVVKLLLEGKCHKDKQNLVLFGDKSASVRLHHVC